MHRKSIKLREDYQDLRARLVLPYISRFRDVEVEQPPATIRKNREFVDAVVGNLRGSEVCIANFDVYDFRIVLRVVSPC